MVQVPLSVNEEIKALGDALAVLIGDIKAKKPIAQIAADALPLLMQAVGGYAAIPEDLKAVDNQVYLLKCLAGPLEAPAA